jgi:ATP synthase protein I
MSKITLKTLKMLWLQELAVLLILMGVFWPINQVVAYSVFIGGLIFLIPNIYFALYVFRNRDTQYVQNVLLGFYRGEIGKFLLSSVGFAIAFTLVHPLSVLSVFSAYIAATIIQWIAVAKLA